MSEVTVQGAPKDTPQEIPQILVDQVERVHIEDVRTHPANPRDGDVEEIKGSIRESGFHQPLVVNERSGKILTGNHRWMAAKALGMSEIPVLYVDVSEEEALRILLRDNKTSDEAGWIDDELLGVLEHLNSTEQGLTGTGFGMEEYDDLSQEVDPPPPDDFESFDEDIDVEYCCPSCGYEWSGEPK